MNADNHRPVKASIYMGSARRILIVLGAIFAYLCLILLSSCSHKITDLRTLAPADALVYLETNDLAAALQPIIESRPFVEIAKNRPDLSALSGVQVAVAVTGLETLEEKLTDEHSVGRVQPHFVVIADTHAWNYQTVAFAEQKLGSFVAEIYDSQPTLEMTDKSGGKYFTWTAKDGRKAFALAVDSLIFFGNDESAIDKCLVVRIGGSDSVAKSGKVPASDPKTIASGYVSTDGVAQIANIIGLKFASEAGEDSEVQSAIAGLLPTLVRNSITEISWTATKSKSGIEDKFLISMPPDLSNVFSETMKESRNSDFVSLGIPTDADEFTTYNFHDAQVAWRSIVLTTMRQVHPLAGKMIQTLSSVMFEPYGVKDSETFLRSVGPEIIVAKYNDDSDKHLIIAKIRNELDLKRSLGSDFKPFTVENADGKLVVLRSTDGEFTADISRGRLVLGDTETAMAYLGGQRDLSKSKELNEIVKDGATSAITTFGTDNVTAGAIADILSAKKSSEMKALSNYTTETRFTKSGMQRTTTSDFGLIGSIIAQFTQD